jgi:V/A-type H+-transporting ATPase subunit I
MDLRPWGEFEFPPVEELNHLRLWFYEVPHKDMKTVESTGLVWEVVHKDNRVSYVAVVSREEPEGMPVERTRTGSKSISELEQRLEEVEIELEDLQAERAGLTRWCYLFARNLNRLEDRAAVSHAAQTTYDDGPLFALQAWAPEESIDTLQRYAEKMQMALEVEEPQPEDTPPTLLRNPPDLASGTDLVSFYLTPNYWLWDPSNIVLFSFAIFFGMILADTGYALLLGLGLLLGWKPLGRSDSGRRLRILLFMLVAATVMYGAIVGSYFGMTPPEGSFLSTFKCLDLKDFGTMMRLSIMMGVAHLVLANACCAWRWRRSAKAVAHIGWILIFLGGATAWLVSQTAGFTAMAVGGVALLFFTSAKGSFHKRLLKGLQEFTRFSSAFGDTLSYLRLFALGLASASLAVTFNDLAGQVGSSVEGIGLLFSLLILLLGHGMNLLLSISSGVIHGLRLNLIEFFNWSMTEEGHPFKAFARKER